MKSLFLSLVAGMLVRKIQAARERCYEHRVATSHAADKAAGRVSALLGKALKAEEGAEAEAAWAAWEVAWRAAEEAKEAAAEEGRRLEEEEDRLRREFVAVAQKCRPPTRRLRTRAAAVKTAIEGLETALEVLGGSCGGSLIYEEQMEALKKESISILARLQEPGEFADLIQEYSLEEYLDEE
jgi:hypothetical protein